MPLRRRLAVVLAVALSAASCAKECSENSPDLIDGGQDAGGDAAGGDAGRDARADSGPTGQPEWVHFSAVPDGCEVDIAQRPERALIDFGWASCGEGCRVWAGRTASEIAIAAPWSDGDRRLAVVRWQEADGIMVFAFVDLDVGVPFAALRDRSATAEGTSFCAISATRMGYGDLGVAIQYWDYDDAGVVIERSWVRFVRAGLSDVRGSARLVVHQDDVGLGVQELVVGPEIMAAQAGGAIVWAIEDAGMTLLNRAFGLDDAHTVQLVGDHVLWENWGDTVRLAAWSGADASVLRSVSGGDVRGLASEGTTVAWLEGVGYDDATLRYAGVELWTATYDGGALSGARRVREMNSHAYGLLGAGLYVRAEIDDRTGETVYAFYRLNDGARATFAPAASAPDHVLGVTEGEVLLETWGTYYRVDPRTLVYEAP